MCGIFGVLEHDGVTKPEARSLERSAHFLTHRGPDHTGLFLEPGIGMVHTRLSLLDPEPRSHQPFWDRSGRFGLVYNGEIYNYRELREDLERLGVSFRTTSDTEVLIESIARNGLKKTLPDLEGMYAFAVFDRTDGSLSLARDPLGIKPLFIFEDDRSFLFSSETRAFLPWRSFELDPLRTAGYFLELGGFNRGPNLLKGVRMVDPGSMVHVRRGESSRASRHFVLTDLWDPERQKELQGWKPKRVVDEVEASLLAAVEMQQVADAPVGALCSGGVDSSLTVAMASRFHPDIKIFHANSVGPTSELPFAQAIAAHLDLDLLTTEVSDQDHIDLIPETILHRGTPFLDLSSSIPFLKVSRLVRSHGVKAVLTGEGADESFWGFPRMIPNPVRFVRHTPARAIRWLSGLTARLLGRESGDTPMDPGDFARSMFSRFDSALENRDIREAIRRSGPAGVRPRDFQSLHELAHNLRALLNRNDGCGMAASVESRFPFLDSQLVRLVVNLPSRRKIRLSPTGRNPYHPFVIDKWILRQVADRYMPKSLSRRPKVPWPAETHDRIVISPAFFKDSYVRDLFGYSDRELGYLTEAAPHRIQLKLLHLEVWAQMFLHGSSPEGQVSGVRRNLTIKGANGDLHGTT